jgi:hypothetical protein
MAMLDPLREAFLKLLDQPYESATVEFKESADWDNRLSRGRILKAIICLANRDGGHVFIGKHQGSDGTFLPVGIDNSLAEKLETTKINQELNNYVDPPINANCAAFNHEGHKYVVIQVPAFTTAVHIATTSYHAPDDNTGRQVEIFRAGDVLVRTDDNDCRRVERAEEQRRLVERAIRFRQQEIAELVSHLLPGILQPVLEHIKSLEDLVSRLEARKEPEVERARKSDVGEYIQIVEGAWDYLQQHSKLAPQWSTFREITFYPSTYSSEIGHRDKLLDWIRTARTLYRGNPFPYMIEQAVRPLPEGIAHLSEIERGPFGTRIDFWTLLANGLFYYAENPWEDTFGVEAGGERFRGGIGVVGVVALLFASARLAIRLYAGVAGLESFVFQFRLRGARGRHLVVDDLTRAPFVGEYVCDADDIVTRREVPVRIDEQTLHSELLLLAGDVFWMFRWPEGTKTLRDVLPRLEEELRRWNP